jgi:transposase
MPRRYPVEQRERATRMALDRLGEYLSAWAAAQALGPRLGVGAETLRKWILQGQVTPGTVRVLPVRSWRRSAGCGPRCGI